MISISSGVQASFIKRIALIEVTTLLIRGAHKYIYKQNLVPHDYKQYHFKSNLVDYGLAVASFCALFQCQDQVVDSQKPSEDNSSVPHNII